jgi:hypothetical protein
MGTKRVFNLSCGRVLYRVEKSKVLMEDTWEKDLDLRLSKRSWEFFKIHIRAFNFTYRYIDDVLSINNSRFTEFLPLIYPPELGFESANTSSFHYGSEVLAVTITVFITIREQNGQFLNLIFLFYGVKFEVI